MQKSATWKRQRVAAQREKRRLNRLLVRVERAKLALEKLSQVRAMAPMKPHFNRLGRKITRRVLTPPPVMDLDDNYLATVEFFKAARLITSTKGNHLIDLAAVKDISPAAALLLVAECDRWRERTEQKWLRAFDINNWTPSVRRRLKEMGFFEVLHTRRVPDDEVVPGEDSYVPFQTGHRNPGEPARKLRSWIEELGPTVADRESLYEGLVEAMTNVSQHAYPDDRERGQKRWWISASVNAARRTMTVMVVDHGVGIARTLPRSKGWEAIRQAVPLASLKDDAHIVRAAFAKDGENKSQTGDVYRGKGLRENIKGYVDSHNSGGQLRVITNRASYLYSRDNEIEVEKSSAVPSPFDGTFIEWVIKDYGQEEHEDH
ncbi:hypothetical protein JAK70_01065 [Stenotrophomonas maltophilia]|nr:hypothetical protein [Stenotrophomonas maltophilia]